MTGRGCCNSERINEIFGEHQLECGFLTATSAQCAHNHPKAGHHSRSVGLDWQRLLGRQRLSAVWLSAPIEY